MIQAAWVAMNETPSGEWKRLEAANLSPKALFAAKMIPRWEAMWDKAVADTRFKVMAHAATPGWFVYDMHHGVEVCGPYTRKDNAYRRARKLNDGI